MSNPAGNYRSTPAGSFERDTCFGCQQKGHWVKDCPQKSAGKQSKPSPPAPTTPTQIEGRGVPVKLCPCGEGPCVVRTSRTEKNPGRNFYSCPADGCMTCHFFQWCDEGSSDEGSSSNIPMSPYPRCSCDAGKCRLVTIRKGENSGRKAFVCHVKMGQGACDFFQFQDSLVKEDGLIDGRSIESPQLVSDNDERIDFEDEVGHHQLPIGELSLQVKQEHRDGGDDCISNLEKREQYPSLPQEGLHTNEADPYLRLDRLDLNEAPEEEDDDWMRDLVFIGYINEGDGENNEPEIDGLFVYGSIVQSTSSLGTEFRLKVGNCEQEDETLFWPVKKRRASCSSEQFDLGTERPSAIRRLDFDEQIGDHNGPLNSPLTVPSDKGKALLCGDAEDTRVELLSLGICKERGPFDVPKDKGKALLSDEGFQAEVGSCVNITMPDLQECQDDVDMRVEQLSFGTRAEKMSVATPPEVFPFVRFGHHLQKQENDKGLEVASFNLSSRNDAVSSHCERFQAAEAGHHPVVIELDDSDFEWDAEHDKAVNDLVLTVKMKKGLGTSSGEGFKGNVGDYSSTEEQKLHGVEADDLCGAHGSLSESGNGSDVEWIDLTEEGGESRTTDTVKKEMLLPSTDGFIVEKDAQRHPIESFHPHVGDNVNRPHCEQSPSGKGSQSEVGCCGKAIIRMENANGLDMSLQLSSNEKSLAPLHVKGSGEEKTHVPEGQASMSSMAPQAREYFQSGKAEDWMKVFSSSQICFKCGKSGHLKKDCNR